MNHTNDDLMNMFFEMYPKYKPVEASENLSELESEKDKLRQLLDDLTTSFSEDGENIIFYWISMLITKRILTFGENDNDHYSFEYIRKRYKNLGRKPKQAHLENVIYAIAGATRNFTFVQKSKFLNDIVSETGFESNYGCCYDCGSPLKMNIKGNVITVHSSHGKPCIPNSFHQFRVRFPSGKVVAASGLPGMDDMYDHPKGVSLNDGLSAEVKYNDYYAEKNIAHMFVGNTCPSIYIDNGNIIGADSRNEGNKVGSFCTDLWWSTLMDHDEYVNMLKKLGKSDNQIKKIFDCWTFNVFDVEPGTYEFTSRYSSLDEDEFDGVYFEAVKVSD